MLKLYEIPSELENQIEPESEFEIESSESTFEPDSEELEQTDIIALMAKDEISEFESEF